MPIKICVRCGKEWNAPSKRSSYCRGPCYRAKEREASRARQAKYSPARRRAIVITQTAIFRGDLKRQPCEICSKAGRWHIHAHHDDYAAPLDVRWLCRSHHKQHHDKFGPGKNAFIAELSA